MVIGIITDLGENIIMVQAGDVFHTAAVKAGSSYFSLVYFFFSSYLSYLFFSFSKDFPGIISLMLHSTVGSLCFPLLTSRLFIFLIFTGVTSRRCRGRCYCCAFTTFSSMLIQPAGCSSRSPVSTDRPEMDAHWSFVAKRKRDPR